MADRRSPEHQPPAALILWAGALLIALGIAGYLLDPGLAFIWAIFVFFGLATVPQTISMAIAKRTRPWWQQMSTWHLRVRDKAGRTGHRRG